MERNVPITALLAACCLLFCGCARGAEPENRYEIQKRLSVFTETEEAEETRAAAFADTLCVASGADDAEPAVTGDAAGVFGLDGGTALYHKNIYARMNPASTTKIMTAILALKYGKLSDPVKVSTEVIIGEAGSSMAGLAPGDTMTLEQLLYGLMLPSGNDAANAIAVHLAGSVEAFADMMNEEAHRIGATGTHFVNANGLTDPDHYTTAYDLYLMFHEALKYDTFRKIIGTQSYTVQYTDANGEAQSETWSSTNLYLVGKRDTPQGLTVFGGKTGTTKAAGYCLILGSRSADGEEYASVVMSAGSRSDLYDDMTKIISKIVK